MDLDDLNLDDIGNNDFFGNLDDAGLEEKKKEKAPKRGSAYSHRDNTEAKLHI